MDGIGFWRVVCDRGDFSGMELCEGSGQDHDVGGRHAYGEFGSKTWVDDRQIVYLTYFYEHTLHTAIGR